MRKMTKTAVTLAAMSAMTAAAASMAFAAEKQEPNISSVAKQVETVNSSAVGEWSGSDVNGWKFTKEDGTKLKDQWAEIDGVWYYFIGETMAQDRFLTLDNKGYFFDNTGRLATGWQRITSDMDAYSDIDIADELYDWSNNYYVHVNDNGEYDYHDYVYCYFDNSGVAKHNEWFQDGSGLWYYFEGDVMVKNVYNYVVKPDNYDVADSEEYRIYGFDEDGAMLVGWNYKEAETTWNDPTADDKGRIWYYYNSNGRMQTAGWKSIEGKWYLFADSDADYRYAYDDEEVNGVGTREDDNRWLIGGYPLIINSYVASYNKNNYEYFYVDKEGKMVTGIKEVPKNAYKVVFYRDPDATKKSLRVSYELVKTSGAVTVNFGSNGAAKEDIVDNRYYVLKNENTVKASFDDVWKVNNSLYNAEKSFIGYAPVSTRWNFSQLGSESIDTDNKVLDVPGVIFADGELISYRERSTTIPAKSPADEKKTVEIAGAVDSTYYLKNTEANQKLIDDANAIYAKIYTNMDNLKTKAENAAQAYENAYDQKISYSVQYHEGLTEVVGMNDYVYPADTFWSLDDGTTAVTSNPYAKAGTPSTVNVTAEIKECTNVIESTQAEITRLEKWGTAEQKKGIAALEKKVTDAVNAKARLEDVQSYVRAQLNEWGSSSVKTAYENYEKAYNELKEACNSLAAKQNAIMAAGAYVKSGIDEYGRVIYTLVADQEAVDRITNDFTVRGELVKEAFIGKNDYVYFADNNGDFVTNKAVVINTNAGITYEGSKYNNAYILFGGDGKGVYGYDGTRKSISIGGVTYWSTNKTVKIGKAKELTVFVSNKQVDATNDEQYNPQQ